MVSVGVECRASSCATFTEAPLQLQRTSWPGQCGIAGKRRWRWRCIDPLRECSSRPEGAAVDDFAIETYGTAPEVSEIAAARKSDSWPLVGLNSDKRTDKAASNIEGVGPRIREMCQ